MAEGGPGRTDVLTPEQRHELMRKIGRQHTRPEIQLRRILFAQGLRYRLRRKELPSRPDLIFPRHHVAVFVHGCFWHGHECHLFRWPRSNVEFWRRKLSRNIERDEDVERSLVAAGWRCLTVWECALRGREKLAEGEIVDEVRRFLAAPSIWTHHVPHARRADSGHPEATGSSANA